ncbi:receptor-type tyrosine-protein phosphatase C [Sardina pilchardus]|uniref:receptor-type tyrosine-protein phosphatase C n=1 Tax=Sardina pilchardus TaxID=27697 RepID=UPI002E0EC6FE
MARLSGLKGLLTLAILISSTQAADPTTAKPSTAGPTASIIPTGPPPPADISSSPTRTPTPQQSTQNVTNVTDTTPPLTSTRQQNTTKPNIPKTDTQTSTQLASTQTPTIPTTVKDTQTPTHLASTQATTIPTTIAVDSVPPCDDRWFNIEENNDNVTIIIKIKEKIPSTIAPTTAAANVTNTTNPAITTSPSVNSNDVISSTRAMENINEYKIELIDVSSASNFTVDSFIINNTKLNPCTTYQINVFNINKNSSTICRLNGNTTTTFKTRNLFKEDFSPKWTQQKDTSDQLCFEMHKWKRNETCFKANRTCELRSFKIGPNDCPVNITDFPLVGQIELFYENKYPIEIKWQNKPIKCNNETLDFNCTGQNGTSYPVGKLEPFEQYICTGTYNKSSFSLQGKIHVHLRCGVELITKNKTEGNTSHTLLSTSKSDNCPGVTFTILTKCDRGGSNVPVACTSLPNSQECNIAGLTPFTNYGCDINMEYATFKRKERKTFKTKPGNPTKPGVPTIKVPSNNGLLVTCGSINQWFGTTGSYNATLLSGGIRIKTTNSSKCSFKFEDLSYSTEYIVEVRSVNGEGLVSDPSSKTASTSYNDKAVIGILAFLIILTSIALLFVLYKIYILQRKKDNRDHSDEVIPLSANPLMTVEPIAADCLLDVYKKKIADEGRLFLAEFQSIPRIFSNYTVKEAKNPENQTKNRYVDILPYDYNRVQLSASGGGGEACADYINASFIEGFKEQKKYIAAQGPKEETMLDFWRMIWEQKSSIIVMVTRCEEGNRNKCAQYWPSMDRETEIFGDFVLKIKKEDLCPDYIIRHLTIINRKDKSPEREVTHIQFTSWPDHGVPSEPHQLLKLRRRVNSFSNFFSGPIVVHCSAGVGRTGTYIGIDAMMESLEAEGVMDIYGYVVKMRRQRCLMVQVEAQYILIHQALIEFNQFGDTEVPLVELHSSISTLQHKDCDEPTLMEAEFQRLPKYRNWRTFNTAISEENKKKNRYSSCIPYDFNRVLVKMEEETSRESDQDDDDDDDYSSSDDDEEESTQYINASYIDGYWSPKSVIAAQGPLEGTVPEFWQMVYQKKVKNIVMLTKCKEGDQELCAEYWGPEKKTYKDISVQVAEPITSPAYIKRTIQLQHAKRKDARQVQQYHFQNWPEQGLPQNPQELMDMIKAMKQSIGGSRADKSVPVVVHCQNGTSRTGIFCALWNLVDCANTENLIDIFQVCKSLRKERQGMISEFEHYQFLYQAMGGAFPVQNGEVKQTAPAVDSVQIVNEVPAATTTDDQKAAETAPVPAASSAAQEESKEDAEKEKEADTAAESSSLLPAGGASEAVEAAAQPSAANGPTITVDA